MGDIVGSVLFIEKRCDQPRVIAELERKVLEAKLEKEKEEKAKLE